MGSLAKDENSGSQRHARTGTDVPLCVAITVAKGGTGFVYLSFKGRPGAGRKVGEATGL